MSRWQRASGELLGKVLEMVGYMGVARFHGRRCRLRCLGFWSLGLDITSQGLRGAVCGLRWRLYRPLEITLLDEGILDEVGAGWSFWKCTHGDSATTTRAQSSRIQSRRIFIMMKVMCWCKVEVVTVRGLQAGTPSRKEQNSVKSRFGSIYTAAHEAELDRQYSRRLTLDLHFNLEFRVPLIGDAE